MSNNVYVCESAWRYRLSAFTKTRLCDYPYVRERLSRVQSRTIENIREETRGARSIRMRLISPVELITFPESSRTSRHAHRSREFQSKSIKEKSLHRKNRMFGFIARCQRQICDPFKTGLHQSLSSMGGYKI